MRKILTSFAFIAASMTFAQVGVNNEDPKATLHIDAKDNETSGILIPRLTRQAAQDMPNPKSGGNIEESTLIYVREIATGTQSGKAANIDETGFYYFKDGAWVKLGGGAAATPTTPQNWEQIKYDATNGKFVMTGSNQQMPKNAWLAIGQKSYNFLKLPEMQASDAGRMIVVYKKDPNNLQVQDHQGLVAGDSGSVMDGESNVRSGRGRTFIWTGEYWATTNY